jgi:hypothetical protein
MNKLNTTRRFLTAFAVASAMALTACGGGSNDSNSPEALLGGGAIGTAGDGINLNEWNAIQCGMTQSQIEKIIGDAPVVSAPNVVTAYTFGSIGAQFDVNGGTLKQKSLSKDGKSVQNVKC